MTHHHKRRQLPDAARRVQADQEQKAPQTEQRRIVPSGGGSIAQLHRTVGNRAVARMVSGQQAEPNVIQRIPVLHKPDSVNELTTPAQIKIAETADEVDKEVDAAYQKFMTGDFEGANPNHVALYNLRLFQFQNNQKSMHPSTAAGYVIESMVNSKIEKKPGVKLQATDLLDGTRPDVVIDHGAGIKGLVDITASNSAGHILSKKGNWLNHIGIPLVMESVYRSIDFDTMDSQQLSAEELQEIQDWIRENQAALALAEQEKVEQEKEQFAEMQNSLQQQVYDLHEALQGIANINFYIKPVLRSDDRLNKNFKKCGWQVNFDSTQNIWEMERYSYEAWKGEGYSSADTNKAFSGLQETLKKLLASANSVSFLANIE